MVLRGIVVMNRSEFGVTKDTVEGIADSTFICDGEYKVLRNRVYKLTKAHYKIVKNCFAVCFFAFVQNAENTFISVIFQKKLPILM